MSDAALYLHSDMRDASWRIGRSLGRTVYAQLGTEPSKADVLVGLMETKAPAEDVVAQHNEAQGRS